MIKIGQRYLIEGMFNETPEDKVVTITDFHFDGDGWAIFVDGEDCYTYYIDFLRMYPILLKNQDTPPDFNLEDLIEKQMEKYISNTRGAIEWETT